MDAITPGIYFGMPEADYHAAPYIGSSNMKQLYASPPDYWFDSAMNPLREIEEPSFAQKFGTAIHYRILHGETEFKRLYRYVDGEKGESVSAEGLKEWIAGEGGIPAKLKADNERKVVEEFGVSLLTERTYERIMISAAMITKNPHLAQAFTGGFPEVSVFWDQDGVPCKARFDYLKLRATVDLKSFRSKDRIKTLDETILQDLFNYRYDIQVAHYQNGRRAARDLAAAGKVTILPGATGPDGEWLKKALEGEAGWVFVFYKADGMPLSKSYQIPHGSPAHLSGRYAVEVALRNYADNLAKFGTDAWVNVDEPFQITEEDMPKWL